MGVPQTELHVCTRADADLHALADGELSVADGGARVAALRAHVARCTGCRTRWDAVVGVRRLLAAATRTTTPPLPADLQEALAGIGLT